MSEALQRAKVLLSEREYPSGCLYRGVPVEEFSHEEMVKILHESYKRTTEAMELANQAIDAQAGLRMKRGSSSIVGGTKDRPLTASEILPKSKGREEWEARTRKEIDEAQEKRLKERRESHD